MHATFGLLAAYLIGSVPFALLTVRLLAGVDIRTVGSGNVGASNAARVFGRRTRYLVFLLVYFLDFGKGLVSAAWLPYWLGLEGVTWQILLGAAAILGHCTSPFLGFRGGKGVATATGVAFVLAPIPLLVGIAVYFLVITVSRQAFLGSLSMSLALAIAVLLEKPEPFGSERLPITLFSVVLVFFLLFTHRSNIQKFARSRAA